MFDGVGQPPPSSSPASGTRTTPIVLAQTTSTRRSRERGRRTTAISAPSDPVPTTNTSSGRAAFPTSTLATVAAGGPGIDRPQLPVASLHPATRMGGGAAPDRRARRGHRPRRRRRPPLPRRRVVPVVQRPRPSAPAVDAAIRAQLDRVAHSTMLGLSPPPGHRAGSPAGGDRSARPHARLLFGLGLDGHGDRPQDGLPVLASARRVPHPIRRARERLPRRHARLGIRRRDRSLHSLYRPLLFDTLKAPPGDGTALENMLVRHEGEVAAVVVEPLVRAPPGCWFIPRDICAGCASCAPPRRAADSRRGRHRLRAHRAHVRVRARGVAPTCCASPRASAAATCRSPRRSPASGSTRASWASSTSSAPSSTDTPTAATRSHARLRSPRSRSSRKSARWSTWDRRSSCWRCCWSRSPPIPACARCAAAASWSGSSCETIRSSCGWAIA